MQFKISKWKKEIQKLTAHFSLLIGHFLGQPNEALLVLKDLQPNRPDKATYLANHKKTGLDIFRKKKTIGLVCGKHKREGCLDRPECPAQPSWHHASVSKIYINATPIMAIHKNATAISKLWKMPLQFLQTLKNATVVCKLWKTPLQTSKNATRNYSGISRIH